MVLAHPTSYKAFIRLADTHRTDHPKIASLAYIQALSENPGLLDDIARRMRRLLTLVQWGPVVSDEELQSIPPELQPLLLKPWPTETARLLPPSTLCAASIDPRSRLLFLGHTPLPRFFSWIHPQRLAVSSTPRHELDIDTLSRMGITTVLTLTKEEPLDERWFACRASLINIFLPIINGEAPSLTEMDIIWHRFKTDIDGCWLIHCGGGKGRAGLVTACLLAMNGTEPHDEDHHLSNTTPRVSKSEVINLLRTLRPGSIETVIQEKFIGEWIGHRWRLASLKEEEEQMIEEPQFGPLQMEINPTSYSTAGPGPDNVDVVMLVGLPGSGKTWLATAIQKRRRTGKTIIVSRTELDSLSSTLETLFNRPHDPHTLVILDDCHPDKADRHQSREYFHLFTPKTVGVHLDFSPELCLQRIQQNLSRPRSTTTSNGDDEARAIHEMALRMRPPQLEESEGAIKYDAILTVRSSAAVWEAILKLGGSRNEMIKFPRTPHLLDLGAVSSDDIIRPETTLINTSNSSMIIIEEKIDGANPGFSLSPEGHQPIFTHHQHSSQELSINVQNRSHILDLSSSQHIPAQFRSLPSWLRRNGNHLRRILGRDDQFPDRYILYGEWMAARHSIQYDSLPDFFMGFDLFDKFIGRFVSRGLLGRLLEGSGIEQVPRIDVRFGTGDGVEEQDVLTENDLRKMVHSKSHFYDGPVEGVYVRWENKERTETIARGKVVRGDFIQGDKHWSRQPLVWNQVVRREEE